MKYNVFTLSFIALMCLLSSCADSNTPEGAAKRAISAIKAEDYTTLAKEAANVLEKEQAFAAELFKETVGADIDKKGGIKDYSIINCQIDGNNADVKVHFIYKDGSEKNNIITVRNKDGEWKVVL